MEAHLPKLSPIALGALLSTVAGAAVAHPGHDAAATHVHMGAGSTDAFAYVLLALAAVAGALFAFKRSK